MIYYRSPREAHTSGLSLAQARMVTGSALVAYPLGGFVRLCAPSTGQSTIASVVGFGLMVGAMMIAVALLGSRFQRITAEQSMLLDEWEMALRGRAIEMAYFAFTALILIGIAYWGIAGSIGGWLPTNYEEYGALFWGVFLYAAILPTGILVWQIDSRDDAAGDDR